jgi:hypothetical protein
VNGTVRYSGSLGRTHAPRLLMRALLVIAGGGFVYLVGLALNIPGGFPMPPTSTTRIVASLSVLATASAFVVVVGELRSLRHTAAANWALRAALGFALLAISNRVIQLVVLPVLPDRAGGNLDLYANYSAAQSVEMLAWGWLFGSTCLLASRLLHRVTPESLPATLLAVSGALSLSAGLAYVIAAVTPGVPPWIGGAGMVAGAVAWGLTWPLAALVLATGLRRGEQPSRHAQTS